MRAKPRRRRGERANKLLTKSVKFRLVGAPRFELGLNAPKAFVLPLHHAPPSLAEASYGGQARHLAKASCLFKLSHFSFRIKTNTFIFYNSVPIVQRTE